MPGLDAAATLGRKSLLVQKPFSTPSPSKQASRMGAGSPMATNTASAASKIVRTHTKFDEDGEVSEVTKTEVASPAVPPADAADDVAVPTEEEPESEVHAAAADVEAEATEEGDPVDDEVMAANRLRERAHGAARLSARERSGGAGGRERRAGSGRLGGAG